MNYNVKYTRMFLKYYNITPYWKEQGNWNTAVTVFHCGKPFLLVLAQEKTIFFQKSLVGKDIYTYTRSYGYRTDLLWDFSTRITNYEHTSKTTDEI